MGQRYQYSNPELSEVSRRNVSELSYGLLGVFAAQVMVESRHSGDTLLGDRRVTCHRDTMALIPGVASAIRLRPAPTLAPVICRDNPVTNFRPFRDTLQRQSQ
jgi:hypothetical protein